MARALVSVVMPPSLSRVAVACGTLVVSVACGVNFGSHAYIEREEKRFSVDGKKKGTFIDGLPDMPEFLVYVPDRAVAQQPLDPIDDHR